MQSDENIFPPSNCHPNLIYAHTCCFLPITKEKLSLPLKKILSPRLWISTPHACSRTSSCNYSLSFFLHSPSLQGASHWHSHMPQCCPSSEPVLGAHILPSDHWSSLLSSSSLKGGCLSSLPLFSCSCPISVYHISLFYFLHRIYQYLKFSPLTHLHVYCLNCPIAMSAPWGNDFELFILMSLSTWQLLSKYLLTLGLSENPLIPTPLLGLMVCHFLSLNIGHSLLILIIISLNLRQSVSHLCIKKALTKLSKWCCILGLDINQRFSDRVKMWDARNDVQCHTPFAYADPCFPNLGLKYNFQRLFEDLRMRSP